MSLRRHTRDSHEKRSEEQGGEVCGKFAQFCIKGWQAVWKRAAWRNETCRNGERTIVTLKANREYVTQPRTYAHTFMLLVSTRMPAFQRALSTPPSPLCHMTPPPRHQTTHTAPFCTLNLITLQYHRRVTHLVPPLFSILSHFPRSALHPKSHRYTVTSRHAP